MLNVSIFAFKPSSGQLICDVVSSKIRKENIEKENNPK